MRSNRLSRETSPYLLQHAHNPVDWYPWSEEALEKSKNEDKPILLSIGYSACHWCHVMERESFEDEEIARLMNEHFVPVKVDREERPDVDDIYMSAVQMMTGSGGWPLTVFLTPELKPFYGGTYFPPEDRWGRPGFKTLLSEIRRVYDSERTRVQQSSEALTERIRSLAFVQPSNELLTRAPIRDAARELAARFDGREGGFSSAPKFPPSGALALLLRYHRQTGDADALAMVQLTLGKMANGGLYDHLGGGFHRYSTDERWLVPHFEKMLYDNALLTPVYLEAYQLTKNLDYASVARETLDWVLREMQGEEGGYFSTLDADSEGEEGKFYVWEEKEIRAILGDEQASRFSRAFDVSASGNWEGRTILNRPRPLETIAEELSEPTAELIARLDEARAQLFAAREKRIRPGLDDKILTSWNGLMLIAMARGFRVLGDTRFLDSARRAATFLLDRLVVERRLLATYRAGQAKLKAYLDDYAFLLAGLTELYESDFDIRWLDAASSLAKSLGDLFLDERSGGFFFTGSDHEKLLSRTKTGYDGAIPSGNAMAATYLQKLAVYTGSGDEAALAVGTLRAFYEQVVRSPSGFAQMLVALDFYLAEKQEVALVGSSSSDLTEKALARLWQHFVPTTSVALLDTSKTIEEIAEIEAKVPLLRDKKPGADADRPRFFLCQNYVCQAPSEDLSSIEEAFGKGL